MKGLQQIKSEIDQLANNSNKTELEVVDALHKYYFNKAVTAEIKHYKKKTKKVAQITKDLEQRVARQRRRHPRVWWLCGHVP